MSASNNDEGIALNEASPAYRARSEDLDVLLLEDSLTKSPWERMQANDDALNLGETLRAAMERRHAESQ